MDLMPGKVAIGFQPHPGERAVGRGALTGGVERGDDPPLAVGAEILPDDGVHQDAGVANGLGFVEATVTATGSGGGPRHSGRSVTGDGGPMDVPPRL